MEKEILKKALDAMPKIFTSNEFNDKAVSLGYSRAMLKRKGLSLFLRRYCKNQYHGSKTWMKNTKGTDNHNHINNNGNELTIEQQIKNIKAAGYKVYKETIQLEEI